MPFAKRTKEIGQADRLACPPNLETDTTKPEEVKGEQIVASHTLGKCYYFSPGSYEGSRYLCKHMALTRVKRWVAFLVY